MIMKFRIAGHWNDDNMFVLFRFTQAWEYWHPNGTLTDRQVWAHIAHFPATLFSENRTKAIFSLSYRLQIEIASNMPSHCFVFSLFLALL